MDVPNIRMSRDTGVPAIAAIYAHHNVGLRLRLIRPTKPNTDAASRAVAPAPAGALPRTHELLEAPWRERREPGRRAGRDRHLTDVEIAPRVDP